MDARIPVGILGATGVVGQKFVKLLENHLWFEITALAVSERSVGLPFGEVVSWKQNTPIPPFTRRLEVPYCTPELPCRVVFSGLDADVAGAIEQREFSGPPQKLRLPSAPERPILVTDSEDRPQPRFDVNLAGGMAAVVGRIRTCQVLDFKFTLLGHKTICGAAGAAILNAELLKARGDLT